MTHDTAPPPNASEAPLRRRPAWLRALGDGTPPDRVEVDGHPFRRVELYKHDAFAATARYAPVETQARDQGEHVPARSAPVVVKFCRTQPALFVPFGWLGHYLANKERRFYRALAGVDAVPNDAGPITLDGRELRHAFGHVFVAGRPLPEANEAGAVPDGFFDAAFALSEQVHARGVAVVDLNKAENLIVDERGNPHLLDFQISVMAARWWHWGPIAKWWLRSLQRSDRYHLAKHWRRMRPDEFAQSELDVDALRPTTVRVWRKVWRPVILLRRRMFVALGVRRGPGTADTELPAPQQDRPADADRAPAPPPISRRVETT